MRVANGRVVYSVQDTGIGIEPAAQLLVFDEFRQVDGAATRRHGGTGLGLALARGVARLLRRRPRPSCRLRDRDRRSRSRIPLEYAPPGDRP